MARGRDHFSVGLRRKKNRERKREKKSNGGESTKHLSWCIKTTIAREPRASILRRLTSIISIRHFYFKRSCDYSLEKKKRKKNDEIIMILLVLSESKSKLLKTSVFIRTYVEWRLICIGQEKKFHLATGRRQPRNSANVCDKR